MRIVYKDSVMISMRILPGFQTMLLDFYKGFYTDPKGFFIISMMIFGGVSVRILEDFYRTWFSIRILRGFLHSCHWDSKGLQRISIWILHGFLCGISRATMGI